MILVIPEYDVRGYGLETWSSHAKPIFLVLTKMQTLIHFFFCRNCETLKEADNRPRQLSL